MDRKELIEKFFEERLDAEEKNFFDNLLLQDPEFAEELSFQQKLKKVIILEERARLKNQLQQIEEEAKSKSPSRKFWMSIAAGFAILIGISTFFFLNPSSPNALFDDYFEPYPNTIAPIVRSETADHSLITEAFAAYEHGDYESAAPLFNDLYQESSADYAKFYQANALMMMGDFQKAEDILVNFSSQSDLSDKRDWYLSLIYIKLNKKDRAKILLTKIVNNRSYNSEKAEKLLSDI